MTKKIYDGDKADLMVRRLNMLTSNIDYIATKYKRQDVLYPMMETPAYNDFEMLIVTTIENAEIGAINRGDGSEPIDD